MKSARFHFSRLTGPVSSTRLLCCGCVTDVHEMPKVAGTFLPSHHWRAMTTVSDFFSRRHAKLAKSTSRASTGAVLAYSLNSSSEICSKSIPPSKSSEKNACQFISIENFVNVIAKITGTVSSRFVKICDRWCRTCH
jgi:hypothetical protein